MRRQTVPVATPHHSPALTPDARAARSPAVRRTLVVLMAVNLVVVAVKITVGVRTGALSVVGAALESSLDMLNNVVGLVLVSVAARAPDDDHPYGHDKFETLGALAIVGFLSISCFELLREGVQHLLRRSEPRMPGLLEMGLLLATVLVSSVVGWYEERRGRELESPFLIADAAHARSDFYVTGLALLSLILTRFGLGAADPLLAVIVALVIARNGYQILRETVPVLVDERGVDATEIRALVAGIARIEDVRGVRSRRSASGVLLAEVTIGVAAATSVADAHALADLVEERISAVLGASEVSVHVEPA